MEGSVVSGCCLQVLNPAEGLKEDYGMCEARGLSLLRQLTQLTYGRTAHPCLLRHPHSVAVMWAVRLIFLIFSLQKSVTLPQPSKTYHAALMWNLCWIQTGAQWAGLPAGGWNRGSMADPLFVCAGLCHARHTGSGVNGDLWTQPRFIVKRSHKPLIDLTGLDANPGPED